MNLDERIGALRARYPYQFVRLFHCGLSIEPGWMSIFESTCKQVDDLLTIAGARKENFSWLQIKEKFGYLNLYWDRHWAVPTGKTSCYFDSDLEDDCPNRPRDLMRQVAGLVTLDFNERMGDTEIQNAAEAVAAAILLPEAVTKDIMAIVQAAGEEAEGRCQFCGAPAQRICVDGWWSTVCPAHSTKEAMIEARRQEQA